MEASISLPLRNGHPTGSSFADTTEQTTYQADLYRINSLIWGLQEPIESSKRCIKELESRPHPLSSSERENLRSEKEILHGLEAEIARLGQQMDDLQSSPAGIRAARIEEIQRQIHDSLRTLSESELREQAKAFRAQADEVRRQRNINLAFKVAASIVVVSVVVGWWIRSRR